LLAKIRVQYFIVLLLAGILYVSTCAPTVLWQDSGLFVYRIWHNDLGGNLGIALAHPLYIMIGILAKLVPLGELAWRINLLSAIFAAVTVANLYLLVRLWLGRIWPAVIAAVSLAVSWTFWQNAVLAEVYTLYAAQLSTELLVLLQYVRTKRAGYLCLLGLLNGLSVANHLWGVFPLACYAVFLMFLLFRRQIRILHVCVFILLWIVGAGPYEYLVIRDIAQYGNLTATLNSALFGAGWQRSVLNASVSMKIVFENVVFILLNFPTPNLLLLFVGIWVLWEKAPSRGFANIVLALLILYFAFAFRYTVPDRHAFFLPFYCLVAVMIGLGADRLMMRMPGKKFIVTLAVFALLPVASYFVTPAFARKHYEPLGQRRQRPYRDEYTYWLQPWKTNYRGAERFASEALESVKQNAVVYAYTTDVHALLYVQEVKGKRPDVRIVSDYDCSAGVKPLDESSAAKVVAGSVLYVTSTQEGYQPKFLSEQYSFVPYGLLWKVVKNDTGKRI
jgi:hypothetical protein